MVHQAIVSRPGGEGCHPRSALPNESDCAQAVLGMREPGGTRSELQTSPWLLGTRGGPAATYRPDLGTVTDPTPRGHCRTERRLGVRYPRTCGSLSVPSFVNRGVTW